MARIRAAIVFCIGLCSFFAGAAEETLHAAISGDTECDEAAAADGAACAVAALQLRARARGLLLQQERRSVQGQIVWQSHPSFCLDVRDGEVRNGAKLQLWPCLSTSPSQKFEWSSKDGKLRWAAHPTLCVDVRDHRTSNGAGVQLWTCQDANADQAFVVPSSGVGPIAWKAHPSKCIDVYDHSDTNGNRIQTWDCDAANADQIFEFGSGAAPSPSPGPSPAEPERSYDVIVVGGGLVGSALASDLAEKLPHKSVLLLEAGSESQKNLGGKEAPASWNPDRRRWEAWEGMADSGLTRYDVPGNYEALQCWGRDCPESWGHDVHAFQCKILGGCGVMNGALMQEPHKGMFDAWPRGWKEEDLEEYYRTATSMFHITENPSADDKHYLDETGAIFAQKAFEVAGYKRAHSITPSAGTFSRPKVSASGGVRQSTASVMLPKAQTRSNFELQVRSEVQEIVHSGGKASAVKVWRNGALETVGLKPGGVLVLSAGALNTPRLLLASGLDGDGHVGRGLSDHTLRSLIYKVDHTDHQTAFGATGTFSIKPPESPAIVQYDSTQSGPLAQYGPTLTAFIRDPSTEGPPEAYDVEAWVNPISGGMEVHLSIVLMRPTCSEGTLHLEGNQLHNSGNLYLPCERDQKTMDFALKEVDAWLGAHGATRIHASPGEAMNHFAGSCALGTCLSPADLRLKGSENVAVADASALPSQVWGHPALTLTAFALKAADVLAASLAALV